MLLDYAGAQTLAHNWQYIDQIKYTSRDGLTAAGLAPIIEGLQVTEAIQQYATSPEYASTFTSGYIWVDDQGQDMCLVYYKGEVGLYQPQFMAQFTAPDDTNGAQGFTVGVWREEWQQDTFVEARVTRAWQPIAVDGSTNGYNSNGYATAGALISGITL